MNSQQSQSHKNFESLLAQGIQEFESGSLGQALLSFRRAAVAQLDRPEAWFWMGRVYEDSGDRILAGHSFYMASDRDRGHALARAGLRRLGYIRDAEPGHRSAQGGLLRLFKGVFHEL